MSRPTGGAPEVGDAAQVAPTPDTSGTTDRSAPWRDRVSAGVRAGRRTGALPLLGVLVLPVPVLLAAHQIHYWDVPPFGSERWTVNGDRTVIEFLGYVQLLAAAALLVIGRRRHGGPVYAAWGATLVVIVLDDSLAFHERGGAWLHHHDLVPGSSGLPPQELGELVTWGLIGVPVLALLWWAHRHSSPAAQADSWRMAALTVVLMSFAVGIDLVHEVVEELTDSGVVDLLMTFIEAGGEIVSMSLLLALAVHLVRRGQVPVR